MQCVSISRAVRLCRAMEHGTHGDDGSRDGSVRCHHPPAFQTE